MLPLRTPWTLHLGLPDPGPNIPQRGRNRTNSLPPRKTFPQEKSGCHSPPPHPVIGTSIAVALGTGIGGISTSAHFYYMLSQELNEGMERVVESFVSIQRQKRRALDLLSTEKGATCLFLGEDCCYFVNERGIVQGRVEELRDRIEHPQERVTKTLLSPKPVPTDPHLVAPFPGTIGTYHSIPLIWTLSLQSLSKVSPRTDSGHLSRSGQDHSSS